MHHRSYGMWNLSYNKVSPTCPEGPKNIKRTLKYGLGYFCENMSSFFFAPR